MDFGSKIVILSKYLKLETLQNLHFCQNAIPAIMAFSAILKLHKFKSNVSVTKLRKNSTYGNRNCFFFSSAETHWLKNLHKFELCLGINWTQPAFICSKLTIETLEQGVKYVQSCKDNRTAPIASFWCLYC